MHHTLKLWRAKLEHRTTKQGKCRECFHQHFGSEQRKQSKDTLIEPDEISHIFHFYTRIDVVASQAMYTAEPRH